MNKKLILLLIALICITYVSSVKINGVRKGNNRQHTPNHQKSTISSRNKQKVISKDKSSVGKGGHHIGQQRQKQSKVPNYQKSTISSRNKQKVIEKGKSAIGKGLPNSKGKQNINQSKKKVRMVVDADFNSDDVIAFLYLLKKRDDVDLVGVTINGNCWVHLQPAMDAAYHLAHLLGRDDIPVGLGEAYALRETTPVKDDEKTLAKGNFEKGQYNHSWVPFEGGRHGCLYQQSVPEGPPGRVYTDAMYGVARSLPKSPRWFRPPVFKMPKGNKDVKGYEDKDPIYNLPRQKSSTEVLHEAAQGGDFVLLTLGTLTNIHKWLEEKPKDAAKITRLVVMGGVIDRNVGTGKNQVPQGNVWSVPKIKKGEAYRNPDTEFNLYLDPHAAKSVLENKAIKRVELVGLEATNPLYAKTFYATDNDKAHGHPDHKAPMPDYIDKIGEATETASHKLTTEAQVVKNLLTMVERTWEPYSKDGKGKWINAGFVKEYRLWDPFAAIVAIDPSYVDFQETPVEVYVQDTVHRGNTGANNIHSRIADGVLQYKSKGRHMYVAFPKGACGGHVKSDAKCDKDADIQTQKKAFEELIGALRAKQHSSKLQLYMPGH